MKGTISTGLQNLITIAAVYGIIIASVSFVTGVYAKSAVVKEIQQFRNQYDDVGFYVSVLLELRRQEDPEEFGDACRRALRLQRRPAEEGKLCQD